MADATQVLPILPSRHRVLLPGITFRLKIGRPSTVKLVEEKIADKFAANIKTTSVLLGVVTITGEGKDDNPTRDELHTSGCVARVLRMEKSNEADARYILIIEGISRFRVINYVQENPYFIAQVQRIPEPIYDKKDTELESLTTSLRQTSRELMDVLKDLRLPSAVLTQMRKYMDSTSPGQLADLLCSTVDVGLQERLEILDTLDLKQRVTKANALVKRQIQILRITQEVGNNLEGKLNKQQREAYLRQQLKTIKAELGEKEDGHEEDEVEELQKRIDEAQLPEEADKAAHRELRRMKKMHQSQAEYSVIRTYLEWLAEIPWQVSSPTTMDVEKARNQLDDDHYGLEKVKKRILEYLAVRKLKQDMRGPILCFIGPPGVGKTSLGHSIAEALGRKFHRISLGGVRDEGEIRGHRRTYIGAMPGRIVQAFKKVGVNNPVLLLDEIDKLGRDIRGDPAAALLEVLDPEQNNGFVDHYLNVPIDLSKVLFIATANEADTIPPALLDRMEIIRLPGYTFEEKRQIARSHLLPKQLKIHGLKVEDVSISDQVLNKIAVSYTRESGVRTLEREIAAICRFIAVRFAESSSSVEKPFVVTMEMLETILGPDTFEDDLVERASVAGVAIGLAWTSNGAGGILFIEASRMPGSGKLTLTGMLGDVMKESAQAALSWVRSNAALLGITGTGTGGKSGSLGFLDKTDVHIHFPAGAIPKDGPSAGVTIVTALVSLLSEHKTRPYTAMTGEITLRGLVLPVGGIKEKVLAAHRSGIKRIIMPFRNRKDLAEVPQNVKSDIEFVFAKKIDDVLRAAFDQPLFDQFQLPSSSL